MHKNSAPTVTQDLEIIVCWFSKNPLLAGNKYLIKHTTNETKCIIKEISYKLDIHSLSKVENDVSVNMNDIACITVRTTKPLCIDKYKMNRITGSLIIIDTQTNETVAAGMLQ